MRRYRLARASLAERVFKVDPILIAYANRHDQSIYGQSVDRSLKKQIQNINIATNSELYIISNLFALRAKEIIYYIFLHYH